MKKRFAVRALAMTAAAAVVGVTLVSCGSKDVYSKPDEVTCVYDREDGKLIEQLAPGSNLTKVESDAEVNTVPASNRFWNFTQSSSKDVASKGFVSALDQTFKQVRAEGEINMKFNVPKACEWNSNYGRRSFKEGYNGMAFNVEGDPGTPWQVWLRRNFEDLLERNAQEVLNDYTWKQLRYQWPTNADPETGLVPEGETPGPSVLREVEQRLSEVFTTALEDALAGQYFCGPGYNPAKPDVCPPIQVQLTKVDLVDAAPAQAFEQLQSKRETALNAEEESKLLEQSKDAEISAEKTRLERDKAFKDLQNQAAIEEEARKQTLLEAQKATQALQAAQAAEEQLSVCKQAAELNAGTISPEDCAKIILALQGLSPNVPSGTVTLTP